ncbi:MAG: phosphoethanolamine transferase domain-containing protein, partial [Burkholderiaceae bacterium]
MIRARRPVVAVETLALAGAALLVAGFNGPFWQALFADRGFAHWQDWRLAVCTFVALVAAFFFLIGLAATRHTVRVLLAALIAIASVAWYFERRYGVVLDPSMLRSALATDAREAGELIGPGFLAALALGIAAAALPWAVRLKPRPL